MILDLQEVARVIGAGVEPPAVEVTGWSVDTRTQNVGDLYFALRGPNHDGHEFVGAALEKGAVGAVVERGALFTGETRRRGDGAEKNRDFAALEQVAASPYPETRAEGAEIAEGLFTAETRRRGDGSETNRDFAAWERAASSPCVGTRAEGAGAASPRLLEVPDPLRALQRLGAWAREKWGGTVIGVTGSAGKTTTKDAIAHLLAVQLPTGRTVGNFNNHVGVPLSILRLPPESRAAVIEIGMNHAGEIRDLAGIARPQMGVVTNVGYAHVEFFDSIEGVAAAKRELIEALPRDGVAVLNADDERVLRFRDVHPGRSITFGFSEHADVRAEAVESGETRTHFRTLGVDYETGLTGRHAVLNLLAAIAVARVFEIAPERLREAVRTFSVGKMRGERLEHRGIVVWNDCYNSNPEAAQAMIDVLRGTATARRIAVMGEMLELGHAAEELHRKVGKYAARHGVDLLIGIHGAARAMVDEALGERLAARFFDDPAEAGEFVRQTARAGDAVLFKGSRGVHVERALERFLA